MAVDPTTVPAWGPSYAGPSQVDFQTDDSGSMAAAPPDPPDFARIIPISAIQDVKQQQAADDWASQQQSDLAEQWGQVHEADLNSMVQNWHDAWMQPGEAPPPEPAPVQPEAAPEQPPVDAQGNPAQPVTMNDLADLFHRVINTAGQVKDAAGAVLGPTGGSPLPGLPPEVHPENVGLTQEQVASSAPADLQPLLSDYPQVEKAGQAIAGTELMAPGIAEDVATAAKAAAPVVGDLATKGAAVLGQTLPGRAGSALSSVALERMGVPAIAGAAEDIVDRAALTADHPVVQAAAEATANATEGNVDPEAVAKVIQSPGFNPTNLMKAGSRRSPVQTAALAAYRTVRDGQVTQGLEDAARAATGETGPLTDDQIWETIPGIGAKAGEATGHAEPTIDEQWNAIPGLGGRIDEAGTAGLSSAEQQAVYRTKLRQTQGPMSPAEAAAPGAGELSDLMGKQGRAPVDPGDAEDAMERYREALNEWQTTGNVPNGYQLNGDMQSARGLSPTDPDEQVALAAATKRSSGTMTREEAEAAARQARAGAGVSLGGGDLWDMVQRGAVRARMIDPLYHLPNVGTELLTQFEDPRMLGKLPDILQQTRDIANDPEKIAQLLQASPKLNLAGWNGVNDLTHVTNEALAKVPGAGAAIDKMDQFMFGTVTKRAQLMSYLGAKASGMPEDAAAMYSNAKYGQIPKEEQNVATQWMTQHLLFAGRWLQGTGIQLGALVGHPELLTGYGKTLGTADRAALSGALRGDFLKGVASLVGSHIALNYALGGDGPWNNDDGQWMNVNVTNLAKLLGYQGDQKVYVSDPFFRRYQDALHLLAVPGSPVSKAMGTTAGQSLENKLGPVTQAVPELATGTQYMEASQANPAGTQPGFPILAKGTTTPANKAKQIAAWVWNTVAPVSVTSRTTGEGDQQQVSLGAGPIGQQSKAAEQLGPVASTANAYTGARISEGPKEVAGGPKQTTVASPLAPAGVARPTNLSNLRSSLTGSSQSRKGTNPLAPQSGSNLAKLRTLK